MAFLNTIDCTYVNRMKDVSLTPFSRLTIQLHSFRNAFRSDRLSFDIEEFPRFFRSHATSKQEKKKVHDPLLGALEAHALEINPEVKL